MILPADLDEAFAFFDALVQMHEAAIKAVDREHAAGRIGLTAYCEASSLQADIKHCAAILAERIDEARRSL